MNYNVEKQSGEVKINFSLTAAEWDQEINKAYIKTRVKFNIPGFRKGHATRKVIENMYGKGVFFDDAFEDCFRRVYSEVMGKETDIFPVDDPKVDFGDMDEEKFEFSAIVTVKPEIKLGQYKNLEVPKAEVSVEQSEIDAEIERARKRASRTVEVTDRPVKDGDNVTLDYSGSVDGVKFEGGTAENQQLVIGSKTFIPGFEEQMIGLTIGQNADLTVKFPEDYHAKELAGKDAIFNVTVKGITFTETPELSDDFVKEVSECDTVDQYKTDIESKIKQRKEQEAERESENTLLDMIAEGATVSIPACMVESELDYLVRDMEYRVASSFNGLSLEDYFKYSGMTEKDFRERNKTQAEKNVKARLALEEVIKQEKIEVGDEQIDAELVKIAENAGRDAKEYQKSVSDRERSYIKSDLLMQNVMDFLKNNTVFVKKEKAAEDKPKAAKKSTATKKPAKSETAAASDKADTSAKKTATKKSTAKKSDNE